MNKNEEDVFRDIKGIIRSCKIDLNLVELHNLSLVDERSFSRSRTVKDLEVDIELASSESVGIKFMGAELLRFDGMKYILNEGILLISNRRIIFMKDLNDHKSFYWHIIIKKEFKNSGFSFINSKTKYVLRIHDQPTLNATIQNMLDKRVK